MKSFIYQTSSFVLLRRIIVLISIVCLPVVANAGKSWTARYQVNIDATGSTGMGTVYLYSGETFVNATQNNVMDKVDAVSTSKEFSPAELQGAVNMDKKMDIPEGDNQSNARNTKCKHNSIRLRAEAAAGSIFDGWKESFVDNSIIESTVTIEADKNVQNGTVYTMPKVVKTYYPIFRIRRYYYQTPGAEGVNCEVFISDESIADLNTITGWETSIPIGNVSPTPSKEADGQGRYAGATISKYFYAKNLDEDMYVFDGWYDRNTGVFVSDQEAMEYKLLAMSEDPNNPTTVMLQARYVEKPINSITIDNAQETGIYTGTNLSSLGADFRGTIVTKKEVNLINTFDASGNALFDELCIFGETCSGKGENTITPAKVETMVGKLDGKCNDAVTPCYVFHKSLDGKAYTFVKRIANVNQAEKRLPDTETHFWNVESGNKKLYFTGFCPFGSNGYDKNDNGVIYIKGKAGTSVDVYLEDCQIYARYHTRYGCEIAYSDERMSSFEYGSASGGSASAVIFECVDKNNSTSPFNATVHTKGDNILYSQLGSSARLSISGVINTACGHYCASLQVYVTSEDSYTNLSFDDKWPTDATNYELHKRTNGKLSLQKWSQNAPSIELGNPRTILQFNGGQIELQNCKDASPYYDNSLAICCRIGNATYSSIPLNLGYGLGQDEFTGEIFFNDGTVNAIPLYVGTSEALYLPDPSGYTTTIRCPLNTYIGGGTHNVDIRRCQSYGEQGVDPLYIDKVTPLIKVDYQIKAGDNIEVDLETGLVVPSTFNKIILGETAEGQEVWDFTEGYGKQSLHPDNDDQLHLWVPGSKYSVSSILKCWALSMPRMEANAGGIYNAGVGGDIDVPSQPVEGGNKYKVQNLLYAHLGEDMMYVLKNGYKLPVRKPGTNEYTTVELSNTPDVACARFNNTDPYTIHKNIYYARIITADEWILFSPPFDVSNIYVVETVSEERLLRPDAEGKPRLTRQESLLLQATYNVDFASILAMSIQSDIDAGNNTNTDLLGKHFNETKLFANTISDKVQTPADKYGSEIRATPLTYFTGSNFSEANYYLYKSEDAEWEYDSEKETFITDWKIASPQQKTIGETQRNVIMERGGIYALQFPYCPGCEADLLLRDYWDYWTGKFIILEGYGPQEIYGLNKSEEIAKAEYTGTGQSGKLRGNPVFGYYEGEFVTNKEDYIYYAPPYLGEKSGNPFMAWAAGDVYMATDFPLTNSYGMPAKRINFQSGVITWEEGGDNQNTTTGTPTISGNRQMMVYSIDGGVGIIPVSAQQVSIYNAAGQLITSQYLTEEVQISLPAGIYLISGEKEQAKAIVR